MARQAGFARALVSLLLAQSLSAAQTSVPPPPSPQIPSAAGDWLGTLALGPQNLRIVFHIKTRFDGKLTAEADSPDQGSKGHHVESVTQEGLDVRLTMPQLSASFSGKIAANGAEIVGTFQQNGGELPLRLLRSTAEDIRNSEPRRPQLPKGPYPYDEEDVSFDNKKSPGVRLAGTLSVPRVKGPFPAIFLLSGSGPQSRDSLVSGHPIFLVLADYLTRRGFAVLRCDDRGVGKSTGKFGEATMADFATDAEAALDFLQMDRRVDSGRVGFIGHSEGAVVAPMVAARNPDRVRFLVLLAPPAVNGRELILAQKTAILKAQGVSSPDLHSDELLYDAILAGKDRSALEELARQFMEGAPDNVRSKQVEVLSSPWFRHFLRYDPSPALGALRMPILALFGERDLQVLPAQNMAKFSSAVKGANPKATVEMLPGLNHLFQTAKTGSPSEYSTIEETFAPAALSRIGDWLAETARKVN